MSEAKAMKLREYGTDPISHQLSYTVNSEITPSGIIRMTDTYRSKVLD